MKDTDFTLIKDVTIPNGATIEGYCDVQNPIGYYMTFPIGTRFIIKNKQSYYEGVKNGHLNYTPINPYLLQYIEHQNYKNSI